MPPITPSPLFAPTPLPPDPRPEMVRLQLAADQKAAADNEREQLVQRVMQQFSDISREDANRVIEALSAVAEALTPIPHDNSAIIEGLQALENSLAPLPHDDTAVVEAITALGEKIEAIPGAIDPTEKVEVTNIDSLKTELLGGLQEVVKAVSGQKPPQITLPAPQVKVQAQDLKPLVTAMKAVQDEVKKKPVPELKIPPQDDKKVIQAIADLQAAVENIRIPAPAQPATDPFIKYAPADIDDATNVQYFGFTDQTGGWFIRKFDKSVSPKTIRFAEGNKGYNTAWTGRAGLNYSIWGQ